MREEIRPINPAAEAATPERCFVLGISDMATDPEASIARVRVQTGVTTRWHLLDGITERYVLLSGSGSAEIGSLPATAVGPGDFVLIPSGCHRRITNTGCEDLVFLAICTPQFQAGAYRDVDPGPKASGAAGHNTPVTSATEIIPRVQQDQRSDNGQEQTGRVNRSAVGGLAE